MISYKRPTDSTTGTTSERTRLRVEKRVLTVLRMVK